MKKIISYISGMAFAAAMTFGLTACAPEEFAGPNKDGIPLASDYADAVKVTVDQQTNIAYFEFESREGVYPIWIIDGKKYVSNFTASQAYRKAGDYTVDVKIGNANGVSDGTITKTFHVDKTKMTGFGGFVYESDFNMWTKATINAPTFWFANESWGQIADPGYSLSDGAYTVDIATAIAARWQGQMALGTSINTSADKTYDFSVILTSAKNHPGVMVKLTKSDDDGLFYFEKEIALVANEPVCLWKYDMPGIEGNMKLVFDFGGSPENNSIVIENIVLKDHANDDGTEVPSQLATPFDYNDARNIWKAVDENQGITDETYFGDDNWGSIGGTPEITHQGNKHTIVVPVQTAAAEIWRAQWHLRTDLTATADDVVDFSVKVNSSVKLPGMMFKLTQDGNDDNYFFAQQETIPAGDFVFRIENKQLSGGADAPKLKLTLGFGGAPADAVITISEITVIKK